MEQKLLGIVLVLLGFLTFLLLTEISGAGILLILMGLARTVCEDESDERS